MKGIFNALMGNSSELNPEEIRADYPQLFVDGEEVQFACKLVRDTWIFTNKRLIMIDVQGITGSKKDFHSIPYKSIYHYSVESAGSFDMDSEIKLWIAGSNLPLQQQLKKGFDVLALQRILTHYICK